MIKRIITWNGNKYIHFKWSKLVLFVFILFLILFEHVASLLVLGDYGFEIAYEYSFSILSQIIIVIYFAEWLFHKLRTVYFKNNEDIEVKDNKEDIQARLIILICNRIKIRK